MNLLLILPASLAVSSLFLATPAPAPAVHGVQRVALTRFHDMSPGEKFLVKSAQGSEAEVKLGQVAIDKGSSQAVKDFGDKMVKDHTQALSDIRALASKKNITLPTDVEDKEVKVQDHLSKLSGAKFDKAYIKHMVEDHKKDLAEAKAMKADIKDGEIKTLADQLEAKYQEHLDLAEQIQKSLKD